MPTPIVMPQLGESVTEGTIGKWLKQVGERVEKFEPLVEVITDKVTAEVPSPAAGVVAAIAVPEGQTVKVGTVIAQLDESGAAARPPAVAAGAGTRPSAAVVPAERAGSAEKPAPAVALPALPAARSNGVRYSPSVRAIAQEHQVDLRAVRGTGVSGRVTRADVLAYVAGRPAGAIATAAATPATAIPAAPSPAARGDEERIPVTPMRKAIAERMALSKSQAPHAWTMIEVDVTGLVRLREAAKEDFRRREGVDLTYLPFVIKAAVAGLKEHPIMNSAWGGDHIVLKRRVHIGIAVALEGGLIVPVIHDADQLSLVGLAKAVTDRVARARSGRLTPDDVQGGTFTVNNTGSFGSILSAPIINHPQAAILSFEAIVRRPVVIGEGIAVRSMVNLCLSLDHRILDGAVAGAFLQTVKRQLESFGPDTPLF